MHPDPHDEHLIRLAEDDGMPPIEATWACACGWTGRPSEMTANPSGSRCCPACGASGGLVMDRAAELDWEAAMRHLIRVSGTRARDRTESPADFARWRDATIRPLRQRYRGGERTAELHAAMLGVE